MMSREQYIYRSELIDRYGRHATDLIKLAERLIDEGEFASIQAAVPAIERHTFARRPELAQKFKGSGNS